MAATGLLRLLLWFLCLFAIAQARLLQPVDVVSLPRPGAASTSPSGKLVVYSQSTYHPEEDKTTQNLYLVDLDKSSVSQLTKPSFDSSQSDPFFLDESHIAFFQTLKDEPVDQLYVLDIAAKNEEAYKLTDFPVEFANVKYNDKKGILVFSARVYDSDDSLKDTKLRDLEIESTKRSSGLVFDHLMVRHWDAFRSDKQNKLFVVQLELDDGKYKISGEPRNLLKNTGLECPDFPLGGASEFDISPDGEEVAFAAKITSRDNAWQTSRHIYLVPTFGEGKLQVLNADIPAASNSPTYAPNGDLFYLQMFVPQYESDRNRIILYSKALSERFAVASDWDRSPSDLVVAPDGRTLYVTAEEYGREKLFAIDLETEDIETLIKDGSVSQVMSLADDLLLLSLNTMQSPNVLYTLNITSGNLEQQGPAADLAERLGEIEFSAAEEFEFTGALGDRVHGFLIKPADFDPSQKYPVAFLIHGGPQGAWTDGWSTRWNPHVFAGAGFVAIAINPHGSTGYGQAFTDSIQRNWGSHPYHDLIIGLDYCLEKYDFLDAERVAGLGASYGGYMINWLNGHNTEKRFKAFVNHDGMFNTLESYYTTDELYFHEREFGGVPYNPLVRVMIERWNPANYVHRWDTPTLVIHGARDYRLLYGEGLATFTALQRRGVPSRLLFFPDENHWTLKPANSLKWHKEVIDWITRWTAPKSPSLVLQLHE
ncbi:hypothetical protein VTP01DRAFT_10632 [Rhizomucor pusillus]|uniref:uncharacterized protein n=1 Tax=Rhizomucor pusillus TaxID=4840 RepID=UPI0037437670